MSLIITVDNASQLRDAMSDAGRDNFSYRAYEYILDFYSRDDMTEEFDAVGIDSTWTESDVITVLNDYSCTIDDFNAYLELSDDEIEDSIDNIVDLLGQHTFAIRVNDNILYMPF